LLLFVKFNGKAARGKSAVTLNIALAHANQTVESLAVSLGEAFGVSQFLVTGSSIVVAIAQTDSKFLVLNGLKAFT
jgi:hypothetical protein